MHALYTCFVGNDTNWANLIPEPLAGFDCYYFTNNPNTYARLSDTMWKRVWMDIPISDDNLVCSEQTKHLRCCPHEYPELQGYETICWMDSKLRIRDVSIFEDMIQLLNDSDKQWIFTPHPTQYTTVWDEYIESIKHEKYNRQKDQYASYIDSKLRDGYDLYQPVRVCCGFSVRRQTPITKSIGELWYSEIQKCGIEDQISFQFVHQTYENNIYVYPNRDCWTWA